MAKKHPTDSNVIFPSGGTELHPGKIFPIFANFVRLLNKMYELHDNNLQKVFLTNKQTKCETVSTKYNELTILYKKMVCRKQQCLDITSK